MAHQTLTPDDLDDCKQWAQDSESVEFDEIQHQTPDAVLFLIDGAKQWIPKSLIADVEDDAVWVATWFAEKEGLV